MVQVRAGERITAGLEQFTSLVGDDFAVRPRQGRKVQLELYPHLP
jgi:hypothetical protein